MNDVMVDLETKGKKPGSVIATIGAVAFTRERLVRKFYRVISEESCLAAGLVTDPDTLAWWAKQSAEAQAELLKDPQPLADVLRDFRAFWEEVDGDSIWCHGAGFDEPILTAAYAALGQESPWKFWKVRCTRTIYDLAGVSPDRSKGMHHHALDDAMNQAKAVIGSYRVLFGHRQPEAV